ncbi:NAD(P)H-binding protein [Fodinicola feengrottensis]|uniref:NAD(P)H-binding protein n=1 Tax=Fodinicola feengrottensis TaxID=435914 RepID=A0ABP4V1V6_9ACTN
MVDRLLDQNRPVRAASRTGTPPFDWADQRTWPALLENAAAAYIAYYPDLGSPEATATIAAFTELAVSGGVRRLVLLSGRGEENVLPSEQVVRESGVEWTIIRSSWLAQNFSEDFLLEPVAHGEVVLPTGQIREPFVDADDIADIAVEALTGSRHAGELYEVTGPRLMTFADTVREIAQASGRDIRYVSVSIGEFAAGLRQQGMPEEHIPFFADLFERVLDGRNEHLTDGVERALGRPPRDFADYAKSTAATGVWGLPSDASQT